MAPFLLMQNFSFINLRASPINDIPDTWIYKYYLTLPYSLTGRVVRIKSHFSSENTPSMYLYVKNGRYVWKDHSSGYSGDALDLVKKLLEVWSASEVEWKTVMKTIRADYDAWIKQGNIPESEHIKTEYFTHELVCNAKRRSFEAHDLKYWDKFGIERHLLERYNVVPLEKFTLGKFYQDRPTTWYTPVSDWFIYGFYTNDGTLTKIYCPEYKDMKHVTLRKVVLGMEQLEGKKVIIIASSLKDLLTLKALDLEIDVIAGISETSLIDATTIELLVKEYEYVFTLFDNDKAGVKSMLMYKAIYGLDFIYLNHHKDISEFREKEDVLFVKHEVVMAINKKTSKILDNGKTEDQNFQEYPESRHPI